MATRWMLLGTLLAFATASQAADETGKWYLNPQAGYLWADDDRFVDDDYYYGLGLGKHISPEWSLELNGITGQYDPTIAGDSIDISAFSLDALRVFRRAERVSPFLRLGAGYVDDEFVTGESHGSALAQIGGGLLIDLMENSSRSFVLQLRPEVLARWDFVDQAATKDVLDYMAGIGVQFAFGAAPVAAAAAAATPAAAQTSAAPPPPPPVPPPPSDSDRDGVLDTNDQCPGTPTGTAVDAVGCPRKGSVTLEGVTFETDSATLTSTSRPVLDKVAAAMSKYPRLKVEVQGHTDSSGSDSHNMKLSQQRADAVREYLISRGVAADQMTAKGYGETQPVADNSSEEGRAQNRRVVLHVTDNPGDVEVKEAQPVP